LDNVADLERCFPSRTLFGEALAALPLVFDALADPSR
jgi:hypothetical protein